MAVNGRSSPGAYNGREKLPIDATSDESVEARENLWLELARLRDEQFCPKRLQCAVTDLI
jgi:hypothetical protein